MDNALLQFEAVTPELKKIKGKKIGKAIQEKPEQRYKVIHELFSFLSVY